MSSPIRRNHYQQQCHKTGYWPLSCDYAALRKLNHQGRVSHWNFSFYNGNTYAFFASRGSTEIGIGNANGNRPRSTHRMFRITTDQNHGQGTSIVVMDAPTPQVSLPTNWWANRAQRHRINLPRRQLREQQQCSRVHHLLDGHFDGDCTMTGIIKVDTIQNNGGTTALTIDSSGRVTLGVPVCM